MNPELRRRLEEAIDTVWSGPGLDRARAILPEAAVRRWNSFPRRHRQGSPDQRVADLAKGLCHALEPDRRAVGPFLPTAYYDRLAAAFAALLGGAPE